MSFVFIQIITITIYAALIFCAWKIKRTKIRFITIALIFVFFMINPIRFKQEGISKIERRSYRANEELPQKIVTKIEQFEEKQAAEMAKLKLESKEILNYEKN